jgi:hypothetical protein
MISHEINILRELIKNPSSRNELRAKFKDQSIDRTIEVLKNKGYIEHVIIGSRKLKITEEGQKYKEKLDKKRFRWFKLILAFIAVIIPIITILIPQNNKETNIKIMHINNFSSTLKKDSTFFLKDYYLFDGLVDSIEKKSKYLNNASSSRIIEITYSGSLVPVQEHYYYYSGGIIVLKYNGNVIHSLDKLRIDETNPVGNLEEELKTELSNRLKRCVNNNKRLFIDEIIFILNKSHN